MRPGVAGLVNQRSDSAGLHGDQHQRATSPNAFLGRNPGSVRRPAAEGNVAIDRGQVFTTPLARSSITIFAPEGVEMCARTFEPSPRHLEIVGAAQVQFEIETLGRTLWSGNP